MQGSLWLLGAGFKATCLLGTRQVWAAFSLMPTQSAFWLLLSPCGGLGGVCRRESQGPASPCCRSHPRTDDNSVLLGVLVSIRKADQAKIHNLPTSALV